MEDYLKIDNPINIGDSEAYVLSDSGSNNISDGQVDVKSVDTQIRVAIQKVSQEEPEFWSRGVEGVNDSGHGLFLYPAMMVPSVQRKLVEIVSNFSNVEVAYDPFLGAGTSATACMFNGISSYGQDINPFAVLLSRVRTTPLNDAKSCVERVVSGAKTDKSRKITSKFSNWKKWFTQSSAIYLSRLCRSIWKVQSLSERRFLWVCLSETIRLCSNDRTSTYKLHARPLEETQSRKVDVVKLFEKIGIRNAHLLETFHESVCKKSGLDGEE